MAEYDVTFSEIGTLAYRQSLETIGSSLFRALFTGSLLYLFERCKSDLESTGHGLRIRLGIDPRSPSQLLSLPWEILFWEKCFLGLDRSTPIVRSLDFGHPVPRPPVNANSLRILVVASNPRDVASVDLEGEIRGIKNSFGTVPGVEITILSHPTLAYLRATLVEIGRSRPFHVFHFIGHGFLGQDANEAVLLLEEEDGKGVVVSGAVLGEVFRELSSLRLVFINADFSVGLCASLMAAGVPAVLAMQGPISDTAAIVFCERFYRSLASGEPVETAAVDGRLAIYAQEPQSYFWVAPVLFLNADGVELFAPATPEASESVEERINKTSSLVDVPTAVEVGHREDPRESRPEGGTPLFAAPPPRNLRDFENLCCDLWRRLWEDPGTRMVWRSGQDQEGVDVLGRPARRGAWAGIQCMFKKESARLSRAEIEREVQKARMFRPPLSQLLIATTAPIELTAQDAMREITTAQLREGSFPVSLVAWEEILMRLSSFPDIIRKYYPQLEFVHSGAASENSGVVPSTASRPLRLCISSFSGLPTSERICDEVLDLGGFFEGRAIQDQRAWQTEIVPRLRAFLMRAASSGKPLHLELVAHSSIAFAAGSFLEAKGGLEITISQRTSSGVVEWRVLDGTSEEQDPTELRQEDLPGDTAAHDVALALGISHSVVDDVQSYLSRSGLAVCRILSATLAPAPSPTGIRDGGHAFRLAQDLVSRIQRRTVHERQGVLHLFAAAPNALLFYLGQRSHGLGRVQFYEYRFLGGTPGGYSPSILLPLEDVRPRT
ncbi:MAG: SAVED domain-containing protein [Acidobacteriota bacterium]|nr:SAVED domain-containing protein [Acidobacteriota bacterium]